MWLFCGGMYRAGSTLQFQLTAHLVELAGRGRRVEWIEPEAFVQIQSQGSVGNDWSVFKTHKMTDLIRSEIDGGATAVYIYRDLRDVFCSRMRQHGVSFDRLWSKGFLDQCVELFDEWTSRPRVLVSKYEQVIENLAGEVQRIADHLKIKVNSVQVHQIADEYSFDRQLKRINQSNRKVMTTRGEVFDSESLLHPGHIQDGRIGSWKRLLKPGQVRMIEQQYGYWLLDHGYEVSERKLAKKAEHLDTKGSGRS